MHENDTNALSLAAAAADCALAFAFAAMSACIVAASLFVSFSLLLDLVHSHSAQHPHMCTRMDEDDGSARHIGCDMKENVGRKPKLSTHHTDADALAHTILRVSK